MIICRSPAPPPPPLRHRPSSSSSSSTLTNSPSSGSAFVPRLPVDPQRVNAWTLAAKHKGSSQGETPRGYVRSMYNRFLPVESIGDSYVHAPSSSVAEVREPSHRRPATSRLRESHRESQRVMEGNSDRFQAEKRLLSELAKLDEQLRSTREKWSTVQTTITSSTVSETRSSGQMSSSVENRKNNGVSRDERPFSIRRAREVEVQEETSRSISSEVPRTDRSRSVGKQRRVIKEGKSNVSCVETNASRREKANVSRERSRALSTDRSSSTTRPDRNVEVSRVLGDDQISGSTRTGKKSSDQELVDAIFHVSVPGMASVHVSRASVPVRSRSSSRQRRIAVSENSAPLSVTPLEAKDSGVKSGVRSITPSQSPRGIPYHTARRAEERRLRYSTIYISPRLSSKRSLSAPRNRPLEDLQSMRGAYHGFSQRSSSVPRSASVSLSRSLPAEKSDRRRGWSEASEYRDGKNDRSSHDQTFSSLRSRKGSTARQSGHVQPTSHQVIVNDEDEIQKKARKTSSQKTASPSRSRRKSEDKIMLDESVSVPRDAYLNAPPSLAVPHIEVVLPRMLIEEEEINRVKQTLVEETEKVIPEREEFEKLALSNVLESFSSRTRMKDAPVNDEGQFVLSRGPPGAVRQIVVPSPGLSGSLQSANGPENSSSDSVSDGISLPPMQRQQVVSESARKLEEQSQLLQRNMQLQQRILQVFESRRAAKIARRLRSFPGSSPPSDMSVAEVQHNSASSRRGVFASLSHDMPSHEDVAHSQPLNDLSRNEEVERALQTAYEWVSNIDQQYAKLTEDLVRKSSQLSARENSLMERERQFKLHLSSLQSKGPTSPEVNDSSDTSPPQLDQEDFSVGRNDFRSQHQPVTMESDPLPVQTPQMAGDINSGKCMLDQSNLSLQPASSIQKRIPAGSVRSHSSATLQVSSVDLDSSLQRKDVAFLHRQGVEQPSRNPSPLVELSSYDVKRVEEEVEEYPRDSSISIDTPTEYMKPHLSSIAVFDDPASPSAFVAGEKERTITKEYLSSHGNADKTLLTSPKLSIQTETLSRSALWRADNPQRIQLVQETESKTQEMIARAERTLNELRSSTGRKPDEYTQANEYATNSNGQAERNKAVTVDEDEDEVENEDEDDRVSFVSDMSDDFGESFEDAEFIEETAIENNPVSSSGSKFVDFIDAAASIHFESSTEGKVSSPLAAQRGAIHISSPQTELHRSPVYRAIHRFSSRSLSIPYSSHLSNSSSPDEFLRVDIPDVRSFFAS